MKNLFKSTAISSLLSLMALFLLQGCGGFESNSGNGPSTSFRAAITETTDNTDDVIMCRDQQVLTCGAGTVQATDAFGCLIDACVADNQGDDSSSGDGDSGPDDQNAGSDPGDGDGTPPVSQPDPEPETTYGFPKYIAAWERIGGHESWAAISHGGSGGTPITKSEAESYCRSQTQKSETSTGIPLSSSGRAYVCIFVYAFSSEYTEEQGRDYEVIGYKSGVAEAIRAMCGRAMGAGATTCSTYNSLARENSPYEGLFIELNEREVSDMDAIRKMIGE